MLLFENKEAIILNFLKTGINPFKKFVSTGEIKESLGLVKSRKGLLDNIVNIVENNENFILPIIGSVGVGKTHLYWALKNILYFFNTIHLSLEKVYRKFFYNSYSEFIETIGLEPLRNIINQLCCNWGALERKYGFFHVADIEKVKKTAYKKLEYDFKEDEKVTLLDIITGITNHQLDPYKRIETERWLLGELMNIRELSRLDLMYDLRKSKSAFIILKLLIEHSKLGTVLFFDDFEKVVSIPKAVDEEDEGEVFDRSWLYGKKTSPTELVSKRIFEKVLKLQRIRELRIIIVLTSIESLEYIKRKLKTMEEPLKLEFLDPIYIKSFEEQDIFEYYLSNMEDFLQNFDYSDFYKEALNLYFPLNKSILEKIFNRVNGNPREITKLLIKAFNEIISSDEDLNHIVKQYESQI